MDLEPEDVSTQIIPRDRHAMFFSTLAIIASSVERLATEIRHLQRTEVREAEEYFSEGQKGSSAMPHKRNPVLTENLTGLARLVRSSVIHALENVTLWHERDISHSSVERMIAPDATITLDFALHRLNNVIENLLIYPDTMLTNLEKLGGLVHSQQVLLALTQKGASREDAYEMVQENAMKVWETPEHKRKDVYKNLLKNDKKVTIQGDGSNVRAFLHASDVAGALECILEKGQIGEIYNIGSDEDKEIMIDVTSKNITIGGPESKVITGGHLEVSGNIISNIDENKDIFFDVSTNYIRFGSGTSIAKFNSSNSIVLPVGTTAEPTLNKGAIRYNNDRSRFEGCTGLKWISLEGVRDVDNNTYIDAESAPEADENRLMFVTDGNNRVVIDHSGNLGLVTVTPGARLNVLYISNNDRDGLMVSNNAGNSVTFRVKASDFNDAENNELLSYSDTGRNIIRLKPKSSVGDGVISLDDKVGLGTTNPSQKLHVLSLIHI